MKQILIVAPPGRLQEGLQVLLATLSDSAVMVVADADSAAAQVAGRPPQLVIAAAHHCERIVPILGNMSPRPRLLFLVKHAQEIAAAEAAGAGVAVVEGTPAGRLMDIVRCLLANASDDLMEVTDDCPTQI